MKRMVRCTFCGETYDLYQVETTGRYVSWSMWKAPCCGVAVDDRGESGLKNERDFIPVGELRQHEVYGGVR